MADGAAITNLILGMFGEHLKYLIKAGMIYVNQSPLFEQGGKYLRPDEVHLLNKNKPFTRFKGLTLAPLISNNQSKISLIAGNSLRDNQQLSYYKYSRKFND